MNPIEYEYREWLVSLAFECCVNYGEYRELFEYLYSREFVYSIERDSNRAKDGLCMRNTYADARESRSYWGLPCALGADLSRGDDFCAFTFMFPLPDGTYGIKVRSYITSNTLHKLPVAMRLRYEEFISEGSLFVFDGIVLDMMQVYEELENFIIEHEYDVRCLGFDPYNAENFVDRWGRENGQFGIVKVIQGARTESVPLGELKKMSEERILLFDEKLMQFAMENCVTLTDTNGNRKLMKLRNEDKIDNVAALMDAWIALKANADMFE